MVEPLAQVCHDLGGTDLVTEVSRSNEVELGTALEWAAYQGAMNAFDMDCGQLTGEVAGLHDRLSDSEEKASNLEDMLQQE
ncbi:hypothetical protein GUJ93_ZPchr0012g21135 [Zizania palustris]|uniref:Uncharacterized protein n=1 Tax=Zizania palustris TaxID=103762 RepID=A0A8J5WTL6_ZIZPA|nr:hypothetical protein GUJ93_ZPchr0012g21135 [Zizania palustris]